MTQPLGYFRPGADGRRRGRSRWILPAAVAAWRGPYLSFLKPDPWGRPYVYHPGGPGGGRGYRVLSVGPDGKEGTADDILAPPGTAPAASTAPASRPSGVGP